MATAHPCNLRIARGGFVSLVHFRGPGYFPFGKTTGFKSLELNKNLDMQCLIHQFQKNNMHLLSQ